MQFADPTNQRGGGQIYGKGPWDFQHLQVRRVYFTWNYIEKKNVQCNSGHGTFNISR